MIKRFSEELIPQLRLTLLTHREPGSVNIMRLPLLALPRFPTRASTTPPLEIVNCDEIRQLSTLTVSLHVQTEPTPVTTTRLLRLPVLAPILLNVVTVSPPLVMISSLFCPAIPMPRVVPLCQIEFAPVTITQFVRAADNWPIA